MGGETEAEADAVVDSVVDSVVDAVVDPVVDAEAVSVSPTLSTAEPDAIAIATSEVTRSSVFCSMVAVRIRSFASSRVNGRYE